MDPKAAVEQVAHVAQGATPENLVTALILIVLTGLIGGLIMKKLNQPLILGYIIAGVLVGAPYRAFFSDQAYLALQALANIGVALLLFSMGLEFSKSDIKPISKVAVWGALLQVAITFVFCFGIGFILKLPPVTAALFGTAFVSTSTAVILKTLGSRNKMGTLSSRVMIGMSIVQDLTVVPMMVLVCNLNKLNEGWMAVVEPIALGGTFMVIMMVLGPRVVPALLKIVAKWNSKELFLLAVTVLGLGIGYISEMMQASFSFGAFLAGIVLSDSDYGKKALYELMPVRDLFSMLFFVSIGMLLEWSFLIENFWIVIIAMIVTSLSRTAVLAVITKLYGYRNVIPVAMLFGMFATSEIAFVVIQTGTQTGIFSEKVASLVLCVVVCSMLCGPVIDGLTGPVYDLLRRTIWKSPINTITIPEPSLRDHVIIAGSGPVVRSIADLLGRLQLPYLIIDSEHHSFQENQKAKLVSIYGDPQQEVILRAAGIDNAKILIASAAGFSENLATIRMARELHPALPIVTRADSEEEVTMLHGYNIYEIVQPKLEAGLELTRQALLRMEVPAVEIQNYLDEVRFDHYKALYQGQLDYKLLSRLRSFIGIVELNWVLLPEHSTLVGQTLKSSKVRGITGVLVVGVMRAGHFTSNPQPDFEFKPGDMVAAIGTASQRKAFGELAGSEMADTLAAANRLPQESKAVSLEEAHTQV